MTRALVPAGRSTRSGLRAVPLLAVLVPGLVPGLALGLTACSSAPAAVHAPHAGSYPVATPAADVLATPSASDTRYALVSAGDPVDVTLPTTTAVAQVSGPDLTVPPGPPPPSAPGVLTVSVRDTGSAPLDLPASSFLLLDEGRGRVALTSNAATVHVEPGATATLRLSAEIPSGHATLTWQPTGHPVVTWDFVVEVD